MPSVDDLELLHPLDPPIESEVKKRRPQRSGWAAQMNAQTG